MDLSRRPPFAKQLLGILHNVCDLEQVRNSETVHSNLNFCEAGNGMLLFLCEYQDHISNVADSGDPV